MFEKLDNTFHLGCTSFALHPSNLPEESGDEIETRALPGFASLIRKSRLEKKRSA